MKTEFLLNETTNGGRRNEGSRVVWRCALLLTFTVLLAGCEAGKLSGDFSHYVSPQVGGRVLAADTRLPLANATVRRVSPDRNAAATPPKGGQLLKESGGVRTDAGGRFFLDGERAITLIRRGGWHSVTLSFTHAGYREYQTNYTAARSAEQPPDGAPLVNAGEVILQPKRK
jgi:hypothetical protein